MNLVFWFSRLMHERTAPITSLLREIVIAVAAAVIFDEGNLTIRQDLNNRTAILVRQVRCGGLAGTSIAGSVRLCCPYQES